MDFGDLIPVAGIMAGLGFAWIGLKHRQLVFDHKKSEREAGAQAEEKRRLEQRLAVLERIVTDRPSRLASEIDALAIDKGGHA